MTEYREILRLHHQGISQRGIAASCGCSRNTVRDVVALAQARGVGWPLGAEMTDGKLHQMLRGEEAAPRDRRTPDYAQVHKEMGRSGVTLRLVWSEYCEACHMAGELPFMYSQFCHYYRQYVTLSRASMHIHRKPGEMTEVDWAGQTAEVVDSQTGEIVKAYLFVAVLSMSQYTYAEAFHAQDIECWIAGNVHALAYFGGVTRILVPDNCKTAVTSTDWYTPELNRTYHEMAEHYGIAVIPARVRRPKDKPNAEGGVNIASMWILAALRNQTFFTLTDLNVGIRGKLKDLNERSFQKKQGSRLSVYLEEEKDALLPLPKMPFELAEWKVATVQFNYHVAVGGMYYSVPHEYIKHKVDVRITRSVIEVFFDGSRIGSHPRLYGRDGQYSTITEHMPKEHQQYTQWSAKRFIAWAECIGLYTATVIKAILASHKVEQQGYRACMALLKSTDKCGKERIEEACQTALSYTPMPSYKSVQAILQSGNTLPKPPGKAQQKAAKASSDAAQASESHGFVRGAAYYAALSDELTEKAKRDAAETPGGDA